MINQRLTGWLWQIFMTEPIWMNLNIYKNHSKIWKAVQHLEWHTCICDEDIFWISKTFLAHVAELVYSIYYYCGRLNIKWDLDISSFTVIGVQENKGRKCMFFQGNGVTLIHRSTLENRPNTPSSYRVPFTEVRGVSKSLENFK